MFDSAHPAITLTDDRASGHSLRPVTEQRRPATQRILIADDHSRLRQALHELLAASFPSCEILEASTAEEAILSAQQHAPDVVVMDLRIPEMNGLAATRLIKQAQPATPVLILTQHEDEAHRAAAAAAGASGYVYKRQIYQKFVPLMTELLASARGRKQPNGPHDLG
jgi:DNA-binding NarL/FixJ family response regulator